MNNIVEPCCCERQLGYLLREERAHAVAFQTNGDVTLEHYMKAVMLLSGDRPRTLTLSVPIFTGGMMRPIAKFMSLEWVAKLRLMTTDPLPVEVLQRLAAKIGIDVNALLERIELAADASIPDELMAFGGTDGTVVIQGRIYDAVTPRLTLYSGIFGRTEGKGVRSVMDAWGAHFRARRYEASPQPASKRKEEPSKSRNNEISKKRKTKKTTKNGTKSMEAVDGTPQSEKKTEGAA